MGEFIRARVKLDVNKKLTRFVSFTKAGETEWYQVKFEKLPVFCYMCGLLGHWHEECGTGDHKEEEMEWGPFVLAPRRGRGGGGRGTGRGAGHGYGRGDAFQSATQHEAFGRGRGAGRTGVQRELWRDSGTYNYDGDKRTDDAADGQHRVRSWPHNAVNPLVIDPSKGVNDPAERENGYKEDLNTLGKRLAADLVTLMPDTNNLGVSSTDIVPVGNTAEIVEQFEGADEEITREGVDGTPQKSANRKKLRGENETAINRASSVAVAASTSGTARGGGLPDSSRSGDFHSVAFPHVGVFM